MPTVIDSLVVLLGMNASAFEKAAEKAKQTQKEIEGSAVETNATVEKEEQKLDGAREKRTEKQGKEREAQERQEKEAREKRGKDMEVKAKQAAQGFARVRNQVLGLFAAFTAATGIKSFVENTINTAAGLDRMSARLGLSARDLSMWQLANKNAGGSAQGMTEQLRDASTELAKLQSGMGSDKIMALFSWAARAGVDIKLDDLKTGADVIMAQSKVLEALTRLDPAKAMVAASDIGVSDDAFGLIKKGPEAIEALRQAQAALADEMARASAPAEAMRKKMDELNNQFEAVKVKVFNAMLPALNKLMGHLEKLSAWVTENGGEINGFMSGFSEAISKTAYVAGPLLQLIADGWKSIYHWVKAVGQAIHDVLPTGVSDAIGSRVAKVVDWFKGQNGTKTTETEAGSVAGKSAPQASGSLPRGMRNNNPGNIEYGEFAKKHGATGTDGRFAIFPTMEAGQSAMQSLLGGYLSKGHNTVGKVINRWAPGFENNTTAYVGAVSKQLGVGPDQQLNSAHLPALAEAISRHENGAAWARRNATAAATAPAISQQQRNAMAAATAPVGASQQPRGATGNSSTSSVDVKVGTVNVQTQATDATGIAKSIGNALSQYAFTSQMNTGLA